MIVFALTLHICLAQEVSHHGAGGVHTVSSCSDMPTGKLYSSKALCDEAGQAIVATPTDDDGLTRRTVTYACPQQQVAGK